MTEGVDHTGLTDTVRLEIGSVSGVDFRLIPAGEFMMGAKGLDVDEEPVHRVELSQAYYLGTYPTTQGHFREWTASTDYREWLKHAMDQGLVDAKHENHFDGEETDLRPADQVTWYEAVGYCDWLRARVKKKLGPDWEARLPSEAEWERACRAGGESEYYSGNGDASLDEVGWYAEISGGRTHDVGEKGRPNEFGLHDMHGNVSEWCLDAWSPSAYQKRRDGAVDPIMTESNCGWNAEDDQFVQRVRSWTGVLEKLLAKEQLDEASEYALKDLSAAAATLEHSAFWKQVTPSLERLCRVKVSDSDDRQWLETLVEWTRQHGETQGVVPRVVRGGSWFRAAWNCRSAFRYRLSPVDRDYAVGFRGCLVRGPAASQNS